MDLELILTPVDEAGVIVNLWRLYQYDLCDVGGTKPNAWGLFEDDGTHTYNYAESLRVWWEHPRRLYPFLIRADGRAAGFAMVGSGDEFAPYACDFFLHEFFVLRPFRGQGVAAWATRQLFAVLPGTWELGVLPDNTRALRFWRRTLAELSATHVTERVQPTPEKMVMIRFRVGPPAIG